MNIYDLLDEQERLERVYQAQRNRITAESAATIRGQLDGIAGDIAEIIAADRKSVLA